MHKHIFSCLLCVLLWGAHSVFAFESFVVKDIRIEGLQRTEPGTVFNLLTVKVGERIDEDSASNSIKTLYNTGFFKDVRLEAEDDVLVVVVQERATVAQIDLSGNKSLPSDKMKEGLKQIGIAEGQVFDKSLLERAEQEIKRQYLAQGKYSATVRTVVSPLERNRVAIRFDISEGTVARIHNIHLVGNKAFSSETLRENLLLNTPNWMSWWNKDDQYSKQKLSADLETLKSFYLDRGYLEFHINSTQVSITPDKRNIYITINLTEGNKFTVSKVNLSGDVIVTDKEIAGLIKIIPGKAFSRENVTQTTKAISDRLSNEGYAFANINAVPEINKKDKTVALTLFVDPGKRIYVRRINIAGNTVTRDEVIRRELRQSEGGWYSSNRINRSKERLIRTQYFSDVNVQTPSVPSTADQVDVNIKVTEQSTGSIQFGAGLSSSEGVVFGVTVNQNNLFGTGNRGVLQVNTGRVNTVYSLSYTDPYFTADGVSRGFDIYKRDVDTSSLNIAPYQTRSLGEGLRFTVPLNERDAIFFGGALDFTNVSLNTNSPLQYREFCSNTSACTSNSLAANVGWVHDSRDSILFPSNGLLQRISGEVSIPILNVRYYKLDYKQSWYREVANNYVLLLNGEIGYAGAYNGTTFPFFKSYFMGGVNSMRGYSVGTLGPKGIDPITGIQYGLGGTRRLLGTAELFFPVPGISNSKQFRMSAFVDAGNVFDATTGYDFGDLRYSVGLSAGWVSPFGPLRLVLAKALNPQNGDQTESLQFQFGQQF